MLPFKQFNSNLTADLQRLGLNAASTNQLSESRISEESYAPLEESNEPTVDHEEFGYTTESQSPYVSESTLDRIEALIEVDAIDSDEALKILDGLDAFVPEGDMDQYESIVTNLAAIGSGENKEASVEEALLAIEEGVSDGSIEPMEALRALIALADAPIEEGLEDLRDEVLEALMMDEGLRTMLKKIKGVFKKVRVKKMTSAERSKSRASYRKNRAKRKTARTKRSKSAAFKKGKKLLKKARDKFKLGESDDLAGRLRGRLAESNGVDDEFGMVNRIGRIFDLLSERVSEDAVEVMAEQYEILTSSLFESNADLEAACRPCVAVIAECLKDIEQGNC